MLSPQAARTGPPRRFSRAGSPGAVVYPRLPVDVVDIVLIVLMLGAAVHGLRLGALVQVLTFGGFWLGLLLGALLSGVMANSLHSQGVRTTVSLALVLGGALVFGVAGRMLGTWSNGVVRRYHLGPVDSALGVAVAVVAVLLSAWLVGNLVSGSRFTWLGTAVQRSDILRSVDNVLPPVPSVFARVQAFLSAEGFPPVFVGLSPPTALPVDLPTAAQTSAIAGRAAASMVKVLGQACGDLQEGSGFVAARGLVVTNAHVVAGESTTDVVIGTAHYRATTVLFDPSFDLAVLRTSAPLGPPLSIAGGTAARGTKAAVLGYPEDGPLTVGSAGVTAVIDAQGRDIYNEGLVVRSVYQLEAVVRPGNSGGPLVASDGQVIGVVFSRSTVDADVGYALASPGVLQRVLEAERAQTPVGNGACTQS
jgi:S1-C subfamily serine protease